MGSIRFYQDVVYKMAPFLARLFSHLYLDKFHADRRSVCTMSRRAVSIFAAVEALVWTNNSCEHLCGQTTPVNNPGRFFTREFGDKLLLPGHMKMRDKGPSPLGTITFRGAPLRSLPLRKYVTWIAHRLSLVCHMTGTKMRKIEKISF